MTLITERYGAKSWSKLRNRQSAIYRPTGHEPIFDYLMHKHSILPFTENMLHFAY